MAGRPVIHVWCACGREATIPARAEWDYLTREQLLPRFRCKRCRRKQATDMRRGWAVPGR
jgi:hypothetical protein